MVAQESPSCSAICPWWWPRFWVRRPIDSSVRLLLLQLLIWLATWAGLYESFTWQWNSYGAPHRPWDLAAHWATAPEDANYMRNQTLAAAHPTDPGSSSSHWADHDCEVAVALTESLVEHDFEVAVALDESLAEHDFEVAVALDESPAVPPPQDLDQVD